jgi:uncharacterized protein (DUF1778 family)
MKVTELRNQRVQMRLRPEQRDRIKRAASMRGMSMSAFIATTGTEAANRIIEEARALKNAPRNTR